MYAGRDFPPADPGEYEPYTFDFVRDVAEGEIITGAAWTCSVAADSQGTDDDPMSRLAFVAPDNSGTVTNQIVTNLLPGVKYVLQATVTTSLGNTLSLWSHVECNQPS